MKRKEAIEIVRNIYQTDEEKEALQTLIPELCESEDERIRKWIYNLVECIGYPADEEAEKEIEEMQPLALAWLEKKNDCIVYRPGHPDPNGKEGEDGMKILEKQKELMMNCAVEGRICAFGFHNAICIKGPEWAEKLDKYKDGDKVRVIVLPKEEPNNG